MHTQDTKVHIRLWNKDFWLMALANLLLTMSVYSLLPVLPQWTCRLPGMSDGLATGACLGAFGLGFMALGCFCSFLVQHYRRNVVCMLAMAVVALCSLVTYYLDAEEIGISFWALLALRFAHGAFYGLAKMVLASTLIIDTCESFQRTEANYCSAWFARFALSLGPVAGILALMLKGTEATFMLSAAGALIAMVLVKFVRFPFRAPEENVRVFSLDRFLLPQGWVLGVNFMAVAVVTGVMIAMNDSMGFYGFLMCGFLLSLLARRFMFANADLKSEVVIGLIFLIVAFGAMLIRTPHVTGHITGTLAGLGIGITSSRFQLFFIKLRHHCQRGTVQSTYNVYWEFGIGVGLFLAWSLSAGGTTDVTIISTGLLAAAMVMYVTFTHRWYLAHKNR